VKRILKGPIYTTPGYLVINDSHCYGTFVTINQPI
jgi:hypothetical protein